MDVEEDDYMDEEEEDEVVEEEENDTIEPCRGADWKGGEAFVDDTLADFSGYKFYRSYFDCGNYFYDGTFNVVKFPKGMKIYHGSGLIVNSNVEYPVGKDYYKSFSRDSNDNIVVNMDEVSKLAKNSEKSIENILSRYFNISAGWYSEPSTAKKYSYDNTNPYKEICKNDCVMAYELKQDIIMYLVDDDYNIAKLFATTNEKIVPTEIKILLSKMFDIDYTKSEKVKPERQKSENPFQRFRYNKQRKSEREWDLPFSKWACSEIIERFGYSGYCATVQPSAYHGGSFHLEFVFCNAFKWLKRDLKNIHDWQYNKAKYHGEVKTYMEQLSMYKSYNVNFHAGNLLEHSIWTLLFTEDLLSNEASTWFKDKQKFIAFIAFIHDIGKMSPTDPDVGKNYKRNEYVYFDVKNHPKIGSDYMTGVAELPVNFKNMDPNGFLDIVKLFEGFGFVGNNLERLIAATIIELHWDYGVAVIKQYNESKNMRDKILMGYLNKCWVVFNKHYVNYSTKKDKERKDIFRFTVAALIVISIADILGSQPYGEGKLTRKDGRLNVTSTYFPFLTNVPKKYRGGNLATTSKAREIGMYLGNMLVGYIDGMSLEEFNKLVSFA